MFTIRPYRPEELPQILRHGVETSWAQLVARQVPGASLERVQSQLYRLYQWALQTPGASLLVADWPAGLSGQGPAGYVLLMPQPDAFTGEPELVVLDIFAHPQLRGRGVARALLQQAEEYGRSIGCGSLVAQIALHNEESLRLFRGAGFHSERVVVGKRVTPG